ncbi:hypothetical protein Dimus_029860 [Dionaea muscipula]
MVEQGQAEEGSTGDGVGKVVAMTSSFGGYQIQSPLANKVGYHRYPPPLAKYEEVVANPKLFMETLEKLHAAMGTKFMIPIIGGRDLDLHRLFVEVTSRGGIEKILNEKRWKEVTASFSFPSTATNASFVLRKYYFSLLLHYEQIYFFKAQGWTPLPPGSSQSPCVLPVSVVHGLVKTPPQILTATPQPLRTNTTEFVPAGAATAAVEAAAAASVGCPVVGVIDGKFESGYLVTVTVGSETLKGVLYQAPRNPLQAAAPLNSSISTYRSTETNIPAAAAGGGGVQRRRRRKKSEMRKRDPAHPKPNRSGYNFFFKEQHAILKPLYSGKDREISRMIGELWTNLKNNERTVYQEKAVKDKERYRLEMEEYRRSRCSSSSQVISDAVPLQRHPPVLVAEKMVEVKNVGGDCLGGVGTPDDEDYSYCSMSDTEDYSNLETAENTDMGRKSDEDEDEDEESEDEDEESLGQKSGIPTGEMKEDSPPQKN